MKKILLLFPCLLLLSLVSFPSFAQDGAFSPPVLDYAQILLESEEQALAVEMARVSDVLGYQVGAILYDAPITYGNLLSEVKSGDGRTHFGENRILMTLNMQSSEMAIEANGRGYGVLTNDQMDFILDEVAPYFTAKNYAQGLAEFVDLTEQCGLGITTEAETAWMNQGKMEEKLPIILISVVISLIIAGGVTIYFVKTMNNVQDQKGANAYQKNHRITRDKEIFLYRNVVKVAKQQSSSGGGGGSSRGGGHSGGRSRRF